MNKLKALLFLCFLSACSNSPLANEERSGPVASSQREAKEHQSNLVDVRSPSPMGYIHGNGMLPAISFAPNTEENINKLTAEQVAELVFNFTKVISLMDSGIERSQLQNRIFSKLSVSGVYESVLIPSIAAMEIAVLYGQPHIPALLNPLVYKISPSIGNLIKNTTGVPNRIDLEHFGRFGVPPIYRNTVGIPGVLRGTGLLPSYQCSEYCLYVEALKKSFASIPETQTTKTLRKTIQAFLENHFSVEVEEIRPSSQYLKFIIPGRVSGSALDDYDNALYQSLSMFDIDPWISDQIDFDNCVISRNKKEAHHRYLVDLKNMSNVYESFKAWLQIYKSIEVFRTSHSGTGPSVEIKIDGPIVRGSKFDDGVSDPPYTDYKNSLQRLEQSAESRSDNNSSVFARSFVHNSFHLYVDYYEELFHRSSKQYTAALKNGRQDPNLKIPQRDLVVSLKNGRNYSPDVRRRAIAASDSGRDAFWKLFDELENFGELVPIAIDRSKFTQCNGVRPTTLPYKFTGDVYLFGFDDKLRPSNNLDDEKKETYHSRPIIHDKSSHGLPNEIDKQVSNTSFLSELNREDISGNTLRFETVFDEAFAPIQGTGNGRGIVVYFCTDENCGKARESLLAAERQVRKDVLTMFTDIVQKSASINEYFWYRDYFATHGRVGLETSLRERKQLEDKAEASAKRISERVFNEILDDRENYGTAPGDLKTLFIEKASKALETDKAALDLQDYFLVLSGDDTNNFNQNTLIKQPVKPRTERPAKLQVLIARSTPADLRRQLQSGNTRPKTTPKIKIGWSSIFRQILIETILKTGFDHLVSTMVKEWNEHLTTSERWLDYVEAVEGYVSFEYQIEAGRGCYGQCNDERGILDAYDDDWNGTDDYTNIGLIGGKPVVFQLFK